LAYEDLPVLRFQKYGIVTTVIDGVVEVVGLDTASCGEKMLIGIEQHPALVLNLEKKVTKAILLVEDTKVRVGDVAVLSDELVSIGIGGALLGRVVDGLGNFVDGKEAFEFENLYPVDVKAPGIISRKSVHEPMPTGIKMIDSMLPIGNGQRELVIGDRQTGKTSIAVDTIINQKNNELELISIYVGIGQKLSSIAYLVDKLKDHSSLENTIVVASGASEIAAIQFLSPYVGCTIGE